MSEYLTRQEPKFGVEDFDLRWFSTIDEALVDAMKRARGGKWWQPPRPFEVWRMTPDAREEMAKEYVVGWGEYNFVPSFGRLVARVKAADTME